MGQNPNRAPSEHPNPTTKQIGSKMVVNPPTNQNGIPLRFSPPQPHGGPKLTSKDPRWAFPLLTFSYPGFDCDSNGFRPIPQAAEARPWPGRWRWARRAGSAAAPPAGGEKRGGGGHESFLPLAFLPLAFGGKKKEEKQERRVM